MKGSILFVDDEISICTALERVFFKEDFSFKTACCGEDALRILENTPVDLVISDAHMPGMNGYTLLNKIHSLYPDITLVIISGYEETMARSREVSNNYIDLSIKKPWNSKDIINQVITLLTLKKSFRDKLFQKYDTYLTDLTRPGSLYTEILSLKNPATLTRFLEKHERVSGELFTTINSAFYGISVNSVKEALETLGTHNLMHIILVQNLFTTYNHGLSGSGYIWTHSRKCNTILTQLYKLLYQKNLPPLFATAGLFHDIGKLAVALILGKEKIIPLGEYDNFRGIQGVEREESLIGIHHARFGARLMDSYRLSPWLCETCFFHHTPLNENIYHREILALLYLADNFSRESRFEMETDATTEKILDVLNIHPGNLERIYKELKGES